VRPLNLPHAWADCPERMATSSTPKTRRNINAAIGPVPMTNMGHRVHRDTVVNARRRFARVLTAWASDLLALSRSRTVDGESANPLRSAIEHRDARW